MIYSIDPFVYFHFQYIRKLLFSDLDKSTLEHVLRQLRKLPWGECEPYLLKCFMKVHKGKYGQIHLIASLTAGLSRYHDGFAVSVVDEVISSFNIPLFFFWQFCFVRRSIILLIVAVPAGVHLLDLTKPREPKFGEEV